MKRKMKKTTKKQRIKRVKQGCVAICLLTLYFFGFFYFSEVKIEEEPRFQTKIQNVFVFGSGKSEKYARFETDRGLAYYHFWDGDVRKQETEALLQLAKSGKEVTVTLSFKGTRPLSYLLRHPGEMHVVDIRDDGEVYLSVDVCNTEQRLWRVFWIVLGMLVLSTTVIWKILFFSKKKLRKKNY